MISALEDFHEEYPALKVNVTSVLPGYPLAGAPMDSASLAITQTVQRSNISSVFLNEAYFGTGKGSATLSSVQDMESHGWTVRGTLMSQVRKDNSDHDALVTAAAHDIVTHELGHSMFGSIATEDDNSAIEAAYKAVGGDAEHPGFIDDITLEKTVSQYSMTNGRDMLAEMYAQSHGPAKTSPAAKAAMSVANNAYHEFYG